MRDLLTRSLPDQVRARLGVDSPTLVQAGLAVRNTKGEFVEARLRTVETRANDDGTRGLVGYATSWDTWYDVAGGAPYGWSECIAKGAATKSLAERDDVRFLTNHEGLPHARSRGLSVDTMKLTADDLGLQFDVPSLDDHNPAVAELLSAIDRGDVDQCSFAFQVLKQEWNEDYTERRILELKLFDVSAVTYPANPATIIGARSVEQAPQVEGDPGMSLRLALALADALG